MGRKTRDVDLLLVIINAEEQNDFSTGIFLILYAFIYTSGDCSPKNSTQLFRPGRKGLLWNLSPKNAIYRDLGIGSS